MSRDELVNDIITAVGAKTEAQIEKVKSDLDDIILAVALRQNQEILITELSADNIAVIKRECVRRFRQ